MKLVVDIPDWFYNELQEYKHPDLIDKAIMDGIILPKGHGRLIDERKITKFEKIGLIITDDYVRSCYITDAPTIIEADKED